MTEQLTLYEKIIKNFKLDFPCGSAGKESTYNAGDLGSVPGLGKSPGEGKGCPLQYSGQENSADCIVHGVAKSQTQLSDFTSSLQGQAVMNECASFHVVSIYKNNCEKKGLGCKSSHLKLRSS